MMAPSNVLTPYLFAVMTSENFAVDRRVYFHRTIFGRVPLSYCLLAYSYALKALNFSDVFV